MKLVRWKTVTGGSREPGRWHVVDPFWDRHGPGRTICGAKYPPTASTIETEPVLFGEQVVTCRRCLAALG